MARSLRGGNSTNSHSLRQPHAASAIHNNPIHLISIHLDTRGKRISRSHLRVTNSTVDLQIMTASNAFPTDYRYVDRCPRSIAKKCPKNVQKTIHVECFITCTSEVRTLPTIGTSGTLEPFGLLQIAIAAYS